jgi:hypothetical protein
MATFHSAHIGYLVFVFTYEAGQYRVLSQEVKPADYRYF